MNASLDNWFVSINSEKQKTLFESAIKKAGSERKLEKTLLIPDSSIHDYKKCDSKPTFQRFKKLTAFLGMPAKAFDFELVNPIEYRRKGGKAVYQKYLVEKRFGKIHQKMRRASSIMLKNWHKRMKKENEEEYYKIQYARFKKIAAYKSKTNKGDLVRNSLEQEVADALFNCGVNYSYEPYLKAGDFSCFPDFMFGNVIIECTMWRGKQKALSLKKKIKKLESNGFIVKVVIPKALKNFYKPIEKNVINIEELNKFLQARVAQTKIGF